MARGYRKLSRKARHLIRGLRREKHASVQRTMAHELQAEVTRTHTGRRPNRTINHGGPGGYRRMSFKARGILSRLRKSKVWSAQRQLVNELMHELGRMARRAAQKRKAVARAARTAQSVRRNTARAGRAAARGTRRGVAWARPRAARTAQAVRRGGKYIREGVARSQMARSFAANRARNRALRQTRKDPFGRPRRVAPVRTTSTIAQSRPVRSPAFALKRTSRTVRARAGR